MRTRKTLIVLLSGLAGSGKTTVSNILKAKTESQYPELIVEKYSFSSPIKYIANAYLGWDKEKDDKGRRLLQDLGKVGRAYNENVWVKHLLVQLDRKFGSKSQIYPTNVVIVDDWRFPNELSYLKENPLIDVVTVRLTGRGGLSGQLANDVSETSLPDIEDKSYWESPLVYTCILSNAGDLEQLDLDVGVFLQQIAKQYIVE